MIVSIWVDASLKGDRAAWAFIAETGSHTMRMCVSCPDFIGDINHLEAFAIARALDVTLREWPTTEAVTIYTDSEVAAMALNGWQCGEWLSQLASDVDAIIGSKQRLIAWTPRRSSERMREVDDMARTAVRSSK